MEASSDPAVGTAGLGAGLHETDESVGMQVSRAQGLCRDPSPVPWANLASGSGPAGRCRGLYGFKITLVGLEPVLLWLLLKTVFLLCLFHSREIRLHVGLFILFSAADLSQLTLAELWGLGTY